MLMTNTFFMILLLVKKMKCFYRFLSKTLASCIIWQGFLFFCEKQNPESLPNETETI
jgi:hypothetical protein